MITHVISSIYAYANRLYPGQPPSNSAAGLRSNLFASWSTIPNKDKSEFKKQTTIKYIFRKLPSIQRVKLSHPAYMCQKFERQLRLLTKCFRVFLVIVSWAIISEVASLSFEIDVSCNREPKYTNTKDDSRNIQSNN